MSGILKPSKRQAIIKFVSDNAGDDIIIAAGLRTMYNIQEAQQLDEFISTYQRSVAPDVATDYPKGGKITHAVIGDVAVQISETADEAPEDLGPPCSKLGSNGQAIEFHLVKHREQYTVKQLSKDLKLSETKIKPMLALLIERGKVKRVGPTTYATTIGDKA